MLCVLGVQIHSFACEYLVVPESSVEKTILSLLSCLETLLKNQLIVNVYFWILNSIPFIYMSVLMPVPH